ncbi:hypothetical protein JR065_15395 [Xanthomonas sp. AmX2]|uniref:hypothetical protein n=1 Tax=Xanthomonas sp. TaxID=29446 RepID=UPI0019822F53|nr:hypothetical protein [Xanthomonas sp.]MBN6151730.1 hypothetical protein [Xanthomonas sp.]
MRLDVTSDSPSWTDVFEIADELTALDAIAEKHYPSLDWELGICLRCLPRSLGRKTFCRYYARGKLFVLDISMDEERFVPHKKDRSAQRRIIGDAFFSGFEASMKKYERTLPGLADASASLIDEVRRWCIENKWID